VLALARIGPLAADAEHLLPPSLSPSEQSRLARITSAKRRAEFLAGRLLLRRLLGATCGGEPLAWSVSSPDDGAPQAAPGVCLALSHSGGWVAAAVSPAPVGLDLETPGRPRDLSGLAEAVCSPAEQVRLAALAGAAREVAFRELWTLKEAWLKRRGEGIAPQRLAALGTRPGGTDAWTWTAPQLTLAWTAAEGPPRWWLGADVFDAAPVGWGVDEGLLRD
jgi:4'-phosphopantetheinyl transferase